MMNKTQSWTEKLRDEFFESHRQKGKMLTVDSKRLWAPLKGYWAPIGFEAGPNTFNKTKKAFVEFKYLDRDITICALGKNATVSIGHSIQNPEDKPNKELGRKIAEGRALSNNSLKIIDLAIPYCLDYGILKSFAHFWKARFLKYIKFDKETNTWDYSEVKQIEL